MTSIVTHTASAITATGRPTAYGAILATPIAVTAAAIWIRRIIIGLILAGREVL